MTLRAVAVPLVEIHAWTRAGYRPRWFGRMRGVEVVVVLWSGAGAAPEVA